MHSKCYSVIRHIQEIIYKVTLNFFRKCLFDIFLEISSIHRKMHILVYAMHLYPNQLKAITVFHSKDIIFA